MKADTNDLATIFGKDVRYVVPLYQRPYVWKKAEHWEPLWNDVCWVLDRSSDPATSGKPSPHFLGAVVLEQMPTQLGDIDVRLVIDGQQRLTTLQLFIAAASRVAQETGCEVQARLLESLTRNNPDLAKTRDARFKVWPTNANRHAFVDVMAGEAAAEDEGNRIHEAYAFFLGVIRQWAVEQDDVERAFDGLTAVARNLFKLVVIDLDSEDDAQVIFESLNARGTPLLAIDLVKNLVFQHAERTEASANLDSLYAERWATFDRDYWREEIVQGRLRRPRAELFLMHWLTMKLGEEVPAQHLYGTFKRLLQEETQSVTQTIGEFTADRDRYERFFQQPLGTIPQRFFERLEALDTTTAYPIALILFQDDLPEARRNAALSMLESWLVRRMICRLTAQGYNRLFVDLVKLLTGSTDAADEVVHGFLTSSDADSARWPDDAELLSVLHDAPLYRTLVRKRLVMLLKALEHDLRTEKAEAVQIPADLSIEHVLPQKWQQHWSLSESTDEAIQQRESRVHQLGNLTLVTSKLNPAMSNAAWTSKKDALNAHSVLLLNSRLVGSYAAGWTEQAIDERSAELAARVVQIWRGPDVSLEDWRRASGWEAAPATVPTADG